ncbi:MAG: VOC family protein [Acidobacteria bacterium]|nr:VOC family protein [Acidobacteriota bacterium]
MAQESAAETWVATKEPGKAPVSAVTAMIHVADIERSAAFYRLLGFEIGNYVPRECPPMYWAWLYQPNAPDWKTGANLMLVRRGTAPARLDPEAPHVLFYLYAQDLKGLRAKLAEKGLAPGDISYPEYLPRGEFRLYDPDGYMLMIAQSYEDSP